MQHPSRILKELQGRAKKRFGQHFLASEGVLRRIVAAAGVGPNEEGGSRVLEIGPGLGGLSEILLEAGARVLAVELDRDLAAFLRERHAGDPRFSLIEADAARLDWAEVLEGSGWVCVANLPYNVGTGITTALLRHPDRLSRLVIMLQKEVAERMIAKAGDRDRGSLSVYVEARAEAGMVLKVPPGAFHPPPKVDSAVIRLDLFPAPRTGGVDPDHLEQVVQQGFSSPRKALRNPLSARWDRQLVDEALEASSIAPTARPGQLSLEEWIRLAGRLPLSSPGGRR